MTKFVSVIETRAYLASAERLLSDEDRAAVVDTIAADPEAGAVIAGTGGLRKLRIALQGRGKRGGGRVVYWFHSPGYPAVLWRVFAKNAAGDLSADEYRAIAAAARAMRELWEAKR